ncbi:MAG: hypothetical protein S4CHLAM20_11010 [Chlamydiia bacterium]|nr:hypothetical protein [Chlamydiia bacterium]
MRYLLVFLTSVSLWAQDNKIIYILSTPRSLSTVMFRIFENRDDFTGFLEPTIAVHDKEMYPLNTEDWFRDNAFNSYDEIRDQIFKAQENSHVVVKDVLFSSRVGFWLDDSLAKNQDVHFVFLIRHPYKVLKSLYKGNGFVDETFNEIAAYKSLYNLYSQLSLKSSNKVNVVFVEDLLKDPKGELDKVFGFMNIPFSEKSLSWDYLDDSFTGECWHAQLRLDLFHKWHKGALKSTYLKPSANLEIPTNEDLFKDAATDEDRRILRKIYDFQKPYYEKFLSEKGK